MRGLPHARGGVSSDAEAKNYSVRSSPRTWGCFQYEERDEAEILVFPTHVGVFLEVGEAE